MSNRVCYPMTDVPEYLIGTVTAPEGGLKAGDVVVVNTIDNTIVDNFTQYLATAPTSELLATEALGIVISGGNFEELADGRLPNGQPDYTQYEYLEGKTAPVLFLEPRVIFYLSDDCLEAAAAVGDYLYGADGTKTLASDTTIPSGILTVAQVQAKHNFRLGGIFGGEFITGNVCRVLPYNG